jgi:hypothetical protein
MQRSAVEQLQLRMAGGQRAKAHGREVVPGRIAVRSTLAAVGPPDDADREIGAAGRLPDLTRRTDVAT